MKFSTNRNDFVARQLGFLKNETIIDLGCRDQILKTYLKGKYQYIGIDLIRANKKTKTVIFNLEKGLPSFKKKIDIISKKKNK